MQYVTKLKEFNQVSGSDHIKNMHLFVKGVLLKTGTRFKDKTKAQDIFKKLYNAPHASFWFHFKSIFWLFSLILSQ
jgi:hypothetical protein